LNAVEIEEAVSELAQQPFDAKEFSFLFLQAFGNKETTIKRLRSGSTNKSDIGGVLQVNNLHIAIAQDIEVTKLLESLRESKATKRGKVQFIISTDGKSFEAEDLHSGEMITCAFKDFPDYFGLFLPLAGISTVKQIRESSFDIRATSRFNRLYVELLKDNVDWASTKRCEEMCHFMARLIFCFFSEDTNIFGEQNLFIHTVEKMSDRNSSNTNEIISTIFRSMNTPYSDRPTKKIPRWADKFPYVNGGLFSGSDDVPKFSKIARSYLIHIGNLDWTKINPDIFGSMIQAVANDDERDELGMHYTSVPNILKVLNSLFLNDINSELENAGNNKRKLFNLRERICRIRLFDPACGSGNFLIIAYKELRKIESKINELRNEKGRPSIIPLTNFRGIELRTFSAEIARLALIISEYQCNQIYIGQKRALEEFLPLDSNNWIISGNALKIDWFSVCPPNKINTNIVAEDLFEESNDHKNIDFENEGGEIYLCGNPPFKGSQDQSKSQKSDLEHVFKSYKVSSKQMDYVAGWFIKAAEYISKVDSNIALVSTNSLCQGRIVSLLWPEIFKLGVKINFAYTSFKWSNLAKYNAGVIVIIVGLSSKEKRYKHLYTNTSEDSFELLKTENISAYLTPGENFIISPQNNNVSNLPEMHFGNMALDNGNLNLSSDELEGMGLTDVQKQKFVRRLYGAYEFNNDKVRYCLWILEKDLPEASKIQSIKERIENVKKFRQESEDKGTKDKALFPYRFREQHCSNTHSIIIPRVCTETRNYLPVGLLNNESVISDAAFAIYDAPLWCLALISSRVHIMWIETACGKLKNDYRYSKQLGWNTFPLPKLTEKNKDDLTSCAKNILLAREENYPMTITEQYRPEEMPTNLLEAHKYNDEIVERIFIGRMFRNDSERVLKLIELYSTIAK
jgi:hypothetical protein